MSILPSSASTGRYLGLGWSFFKMLKVLTLHVHLTYSKVCRPSKLPTLTPNCSGIFQKTSWHIEQHVTFWLSKQKLLKTFEKQWLMLLCFRWTPRCWNLRSGTWWCAWQLFDTDASCRGVYTSVLQRAKFRVLSYCLRNLALHTLEISSIWHSNVT